MRPQQKSVVAGSLAAALALVLVLGGAGSARAGDVLSDKVVDSLLFRAGRLQGPGAVEQSSVGRESLFKGGRQQAAPRRWISPGWRPKGRNVMGVALVGVGLLALGAWRFGWLFRSRHSQGSSIRLVSTRALGDKRAIAVVEVEGHRLVVGMTPHQMTLLASLDDLGEKSVELPQEKEPEFSIPPGFHHASLPMGFGFVEGRYTDVQGLVAARKG